MRIFYFLLIITFFSCSITKNNFQKEEIRINVGQNKYTNLEYFNLKGKVKTVQETHYINNAGKIQESYTVTHNFNPYGNLDDYEYITNEGKQGEFGNYFFNESQQLIRKDDNRGSLYIEHLEGIIQHEKFYKKEDATTPFYEITKTFNDADNLIYRKQIGPEAIGISEQHFLYDSKSRVIEKKNVSSKGRVSITKYEYNRTNVIVSEFKNLDPKVAFPNTPNNIKHFSYNEHNLKVSSLNPQSGYEGKVVYDYEFDSHSNWLKTYTQNGKVKYCSKIRKIEYYE